MSRPKDGGSSMGVITDPIADMLTRIRNANTAHHETVDVPASRMKKAVADILKEEGFIREYSLVQEGPQGTLRITLKYGPEKEKVITGLRRISRPGLRVYTSRTEIPRVLGGLGLVIISTSKGIMSGKQAKREGFGGEVLAYVW
jgi:small subunit ribosomal protein S8